MEPLSHSHIFINTPLPFSDIPDNKLLSVQSVLDTYEMRLMTLDRILRKCCILLLVISTVSQNLSIPCINSFLCLHEPVWLEINFLYDGYKSPPQNVNIHVHPSFLQIYTARFPDPYPYVQIHWMLGSDGENMHTCNMHLSTVLTCTVYTMYTCSTPSGKVHKISRASLE